MEIILKYFEHNSPVEPKLEDRITGMETYDAKGFGTPTTALQSFAIASFSIISILVAICLHRSNSFFVV